MENPEAPVWEQAYAMAALLEREHRLPKPCYLLRVWGSAATCPEFKAKYGVANEKDNTSGGIYAFWFDSDQELKTFQTEMMAFCKTLPKSDLAYDNKNDTDDDILPRKRVACVVTLKYNGKLYEVRKDYGYGYRLGTVIFDWEENNHSCDCNRLTMIDRFHPGALTEEDAAENRGCSDGYAVVTDFRFELTD